uniref:Peptidase S8/S53 domain-containing protein n=1 Tax=Panagrolaimus davidi TaxID=227884 RepID=A0A914QND4_9BILA
MVEFLQRYPEYDGRGLLIAIIDGAIDVSLDGLQKTSTGLPKVIDCFDFSGAGDVDTSLIKKTGTDETNLELLSGKKIIIPQNWKNPSNEWHIGIKFWKEINSQKLADINESTDEKREEEQSSEEENKAETIKPKEEEIFEKINFFDALPKNDIVDCIVWNDGKIWCTCIVPAASAAENIENVKVLTNFRDKHEYCFIFDNISCCATIKNEGNLLELFIPLSGHGSYVSQVAAAHYPSQPEKDGLAPGAQIISMNVMNECNNNENIKEKAIEKAVKNLHCLTSKTM